MDSPKNILVIGATGVIGVFITQAILDASASFGNVAIFTSQSTVENKKELLQKWQEQGVEVIVGDLTKDTDISEAYKRVPPFTPYNRHPSLTYHCRLRHRRLCPGQERAS